MSPPGKTLIGSSLPPTRALMTTWAIGAGWLMSCAAYARVLGSNNPSGLLLAIPAALLCGGAVYRAGGGRKPTAPQLVGSTIFASCLCPFATIGPILIFEAGAQGLHPAGELLGMVICFSVMGAFLMVPFGMGFGAVFTLAWRAIDSGRARGHRSALEVAWMAFGSGWVLIGASLVMVDRFLPRHPRIPVHDSGPTLVVVISVAFAVLGAAVLLCGVAHHARRHRLAGRARRGKLPGYAVVPAYEVESPRRLPTLFPEGPFDAVLVRRAEPTGPFRDAPDVPVARMAR